MNRKLIAILRGITPDEIDEVAEAIINQGIDAIEVPLNSPNAFESILRLCTNFKGRGMFGAGTVLRVSEVEKLANLGVSMIVSPNCNLEVIASTKALGIKSYPGVMTPSECFSALDAGADGLKLFPGEVITPTGLRALRAILPSQTQCYVVGGAHQDNFSVWKKAGADGFGIGSAIYKAGDKPEEVAEKAKRIVHAYDEVMK